MLGWGSTLYTLFGTVSELKKSRLSEGEYVRTLGYYNEGDGGGNEFKIVQKVNGEDNDGTIVKLSNGLYAVSILDIDKINIKHFGAPNNASAHSDVYFKKYVDWCKEYRDYIVRLPAMALSLYETYVFTPNTSGKNIKLIGEHKVEHQYGAEISIDGNRNTHSGTVICSHATGGIIFDIQNTSLYAGVVLEGIALYSNNHKTIAVRIISGGQELKIHDLTINNFAGGAILFNNVYDGYITNLTVKNCGKYYDNTSHPALRFYADRLESTVSLESVTNTNALHITNFHLEHCDCFCSFEKTADIFFVNGKIESMSGEGDGYEIDPIASSEPFIDFKGEGCMVSFNSVFFKTPSTFRMMKSNNNLKLSDLPYFIKFRQKYRGLVSFSNCMFLSYTGGGLPFDCESRLTHCIITASVFRYVATGRIAIRANQLTMIGCTICLENDETLYASSILDELQKGKPIEVRNDCIFIGCKFTLGRDASFSDSTSYKKFVFNIVGTNNIIENNMYNFIDDIGTDGLIYP